MTKDGLFTPHSTWEGECKARAAAMAEDQKTIERLRAQNTELALQALASDGQAEEAYQAQLSAESAASWANIKAEQAIAEVKMLRVENEALRARVEALEAALGKIILTTHAQSGAVVQSCRQIARAALQQEGE